jgi:hypothetical protein
MTHDKPDKQVQLTDYRVVVNNNWDSEATEKVLLKS